MNRHVIRYAMVLSLAFLVCSGTIANADDPNGVRRPSYPSGFAPGTRVVLLADAPALGEGLLKGMAGTIVCCDATDCSASILVSWDLWTGGRDEGDRCVTTLGGPYPAGSATWVDPREVLLGQPFDRMGTLREGDKGCLYLETDDGESYYLVIGPEFREQWWVVLPGQYVRIRGLLNTNAPDPTVKRMCSQRDGDIYQPIMTAYDWIGESCADPWVCSFMYGDSVVLIGEDNPNGAVDLPRGTSGTIICSNPRAQNSVLVSWNLWTNGGDPDEYILCGERLVGLFPPGSTWWVPVTDLATTFQTACGNLQGLRICSDGQCEDVSAVGLFVENAGLYYLPDLTPETAPIGAAFIASGLHAPYAAIPEGIVVASGKDIGLAEVILQSVLLPCPTYGCCRPAYKAGDRVRLLVDEPGGARDLLTYAGGKVICCNSQNPGTPIFVSWDFWTGGIDDDESCDSSGASSMYYPPTSGWWVACSEIEPVILPDLYDVGERFRSFTPPSVVAGKAGQGLAISGMISNRGGTQSGSFTVAIYASSDAEITIEDYLIGKVGMDIMTGGSVNMSWAREFPTDIPAGTYNIGWLIDSNNSVKEAMETDNMVVIEAGKLTVTEE